MSDSVAMVTGGGRGSAWGSPGRWPRPAFAWPWPTSTPAAAAAAEELRRRGAEVLPVSLDVTDAAPGTAPWRR